MNNIHSAYSLIKRLLEPAFLNKKQAFKSVFEPGYTALTYDILPLFTIPHLILLVQAQNTREILYFTGTIFCLYIVLWFGQYVQRSWFWSGAYTFERSIEQKYRPIILKKDNLAMESYGTGNIQSIVHSGMYAWTFFANDTLWYISRILINFIAGIYFSFTLGFVYVFVYVGLLILVSVLYFLVKLKELDIDTVTNDLENLRNASSVRSIMSRGEILFSSKVETETEGITNISSQKLKQDIKASDYKFLADFVPSFLGLFLPFIAVCIFIFLNKSITTQQAALLVGFIFFSSRLSMNIWTFLWYIKMSIDNFPKIKKFWDFIDDVPELAGYKDGSEFIHRGGEVELKNIHFSYEK